MACSSCKDRHPLTSQLTKVINRELRVFNTTCSKFRSWDNMEIQKDIKSMCYKDQTTYCQSTNAFHYSNDHKPKKKPTKIRNKM